MERIHEETFKVRCTEVNRCGLVKPETYFDFFQETASVHALQLGCGFHALAEHKQAWVLSKIKMEILRHAKLDDLLTVKTWPQGFKRLYALREAVLVDPQGELARLTSYWILLDMEHLRPLRLPESLDISFPDNSDLPQFFDLNGKVFPLDLSSPIHCLVPEHFIDANGHMNNARYIALVGDWLAKQQGRPAVLQEITAHFLLATQAWEELTIQGNLQNDGQFTVSIQENNEKHTPHFVCQGKIKVTDL